MGRKKRVSIIRGERVALFLFILFLVLFFFIFWTYPIPGIDINPAGL